MIDDNTSEQQADSITVNVQTGERSDNQKAQTFDIVEHENVKYIAADKVEQYKAHKAAELAAMQSEIDKTLAAIEEIDHINSVEERKAELQKLIDQYGDDYDMMDVVDFGNEQEYTEVMDYLTAAYQSTFGDPSAGFGPAKEPQANTQKTLYEYGQKMARQAYEKRGR